MGWLGGWVVVLGNSKCTLMQLSGCAEHSAVCLQLAVLEKAYCLFRKRKEDAASTKGKGKEEIAFSQYKPL